jgi:hypothetical protein
MPVPIRHVFSQGSNLAALARVGWSIVAPGKRPSVDLPGPLLQATLAPRPDDLLTDFVAWAGGDRAAWDGVPPHFFPQWGLPLLARTLDDQPHPVAKVLNQGCKLTINAPLPADEPLQISAQLLSVSDEPSKARLNQRLITGTASAPEAIVADVYAVVPRPSTTKTGTRPDRPVVDPAWPRIASADLPSTAGWQFALLTGDFNPIHWLPPYARMAGFKAVILHGFGMLALVVEALAAAHGPDRIHAVDVRFLRPLVLPASIEIAAHDGHCGLGIAGQPASMLGTYTLHGDTP